VALTEVFHRDDYSRNNTTRFVCNLSSNKLTLDHINQFATMLEGSSLRIYALDLSFSRIFSASWEPLLKVDYLQMGGNYLPALTETDELSKLQESGCVSLALPITGYPAPQRQKEWNDIATDFGS